MATQTVFVPDIGAEGAEIIEILVTVGDVIEENQDIVTLETDKASMDVPAALGGKITALKVNVGDKVSEGDVLLEVEAGDAAAAVTESTAAPAAAEADPVEQPAASASGGSHEVAVNVPDGAEGADVIELCVAEGDEVEEGDSLVVLETDKASMEVPAPQAGKVLKFTVKEGDKTEEGGVILTLAVTGSAPAASPAPAKAEKAEATAAPAPAPAAKPAPVATPTDDSAIISASQSKDIYAGPAVRKLAREMSVDLTQVKGTSERGRISKDDVKAYVKQVMTGQKAAPAAGGNGASIPPIPAVDFSQFGDIELQPMSKIKKLTAANMSANWLNIPHVTQFDDADITDLETFRKSLKPEAEKRGVKLTPLPFLLKACAAALIAEPSFNVSLHHDGEHIVQKKYVNIGVAVDSPVGLVVPVIRDVDKKGLWELAAEFMAIVEKARNGKLTPKDMQGGCFTISSLGALGGQGFTPIVNAPEVAILAVSKAEIKPKWNGSEFIPRNMLPLSLSYDHRAINGGDAGRFFTYLNSVISDVRRLLL